MTGGSWPIRIAVQEGREAEGEGRVGSGGSGSGVELATRRSCARQGRPAGPRARLPFPQRPSRPPSSSSHPLGTLLLQTWCAQACLWPSWASRLTILARGLPPRPSTASAAPSRPSRPPPAGSRRRPRSPSTGRLWTTSLLAYVRRCCLPLIRRAADTLCPLPGREEPAAGVRLRDARAHLARAQAQPRAVHGMERPPAVAPRPVRVAVRAPLVPFAGGLRGCRLTGRGVAAQVARGPPRPPAGRHQPDDVDPQEPAKGLLDLEPPAVVPVQRPVWSFSGSGAFLKRCRVVVDRWWGGGAGAVAGGGPGAGSRRSEGHDVEARGMGARAAPRRQDAVGRPTQLCVLLSSGLLQSQPGGADVPHNRSARLPRPCSLQSTPGTTAGTSSSRSRPSRPTRQRRPARASAGRSSRSRAARSRRTFQTSRPGTSACASSARARLRRTTSRRLVRDSRIPPPALSR